MSALTDTFTAIANAIRAKLGVSTTYTPAQMASAIASIPKAVLQTKTQTVTPSANWSGTNTNNATISPDSGYDGMSQVNVNVPMLRDNTLMTADTVDTPGTVYNGNTSESNSQKLLRMHPTKDGMSYTGSYLFLKPNSYLGNASTSDVVSGKTFSSSNGIQLTGTGSSGTDTSDATLDSGSRMLSGYTAYARGTKYTGSITSRSASSETISSAKTYYSGYYPSSWTVTPSGSTPSGTKYDTYSSNGTYTADVSNYASHSVTVSVDAGKKVDVRTVNRTTSAKATYTLPFNPGYTIGFHNSYKAMFFWNFKDWVGNQLLARTNKYLTYCATVEKDGVYGISGESSSRTVTLMESSSSTMAGDWTIISIEF